MKLSAALLLFIASGAGVLLAQPPQNGNLPAGPAGASGGPGPGRGRGGRGASPIEIVGDAKAGEAYFNGAGKCSTCHSPTGDLKGIATRLTGVALEGRMVLPRGSGGYPSLGAAPAKPDLPLKVVVKMPSGPALSGSVVSLDDFHVTFKDSTGALQTITRNGDVPSVTITDPAQAHLDLLPKLTDKIMHDLTAYLVTLK